jgi:ATP-dependent RNA helicase RhlE
VNFTEFNLDSRLMEGIEAMGYSVATPVQTQVIPKILEGRDIIASAQTGTGKTAAFLLPVIHKIITTKHDDHIKALVIVPTRELAVQIDQHLEGLSYFTHVSNIAVYGGTDGSSFSREKQALATGADIIIGTPGRLIAHLSMGYVKVNSLRYLVLDEADRMLDMGFFDDIMRIISFLPKKRQNLLFAATMPDKIRELARKVLVNPDEVNIAVSKPAERVLQAAYSIYENQKMPLVKHLLQGRKLRSVLIFCSTKSKAKQLFKELKVTGSVVGEIHSDLNQEEREKVMMGFRNRVVNILVATDIVSRGIDVEDIDLVINYDVPNDGEDYIHRIGRTARAQAEGMAITLINEKEQGKFRRIEEMLGATVVKSALPVQFGSSPSNKVRIQAGREKRRFRGGNNRQSDKGGDGGNSNSRRNSGNNRFRRKSSN